MEFAFAKRILEVLLITLSVDFGIRFGSCSVKYSSSNDGYYASPSSHSKQKLPVILMHKQAMAGDGEFNFAFAGDNGIKQGETIHPDGTRNGAYSYVDPNGETISVKYTAGKDGFKILQGDHIPRASIALPSYNTPQYSVPAPGSLYSAASVSSGKYVASPGAGLATSSSSLASDEVVDDFVNAVGLGPTASYSHYRGKVNPNFKSVYRVHEESSAEQVPQMVPYYGKNRRDFDIEGNRNEPHSFGHGYSFEFGQSSR